MKIAVSSDHAGFALKEEVKALLEQEGHEVLDFGPYNEEPCDLSDYVYPASLAVAEGKADRGIFVDGVGYGSAMILSARNWRVPTPTRMFSASAERSSDRHWRLKSGGLG